MTDTNAPTALHVLGCPEVPVQTSLVLYLAYRLRQRGFASTIAGTKAARTLLDLADPERHYLGEIVDLDQCIARMAEGRADWDNTFVYVHNDAGVSYTATLASLSKGRVHAIVFGAHAAEVAEGITFPCRVIAAKATHNPLPLKQKLDRLLEEGLHGVR